MDKQFIKTERLTIRPVVASDWIGIKNIWDDFNASEYVIYDTPKDTSDASLKSRIERWEVANNSSNEHLFFAIIHDEEMIGFASFNIEDDGYELGYGFTSKAQGQGFATESLSALFSHMKELGTKRITAGTALKNTPSVKLLKRLGFELVERETLSFHKDEFGNDIIFEGGIFTLTL